jgi:hypothetical protein
MRPIPQSADVKDYVNWSLKEMGQAVVVVEGEYALPLPKVPVGIRIFDVNLSIFKPRLPLATEIPMAPWMDTNTVMSGGNVVQKSYPIGWGY